MDSENKYAIVELKSGVQEKVTEGSIVKVPGFMGEPGEKINFDKVMFLRKGKKIQFGEPLINDVSVTGEILEHKTGPKIRVFKMKSKKNYRRTIGSREKFTKVKILKIG